MNEHMNWSEQEQNPEQGQAGQVRRPRRKNRGLLRRLGSLTLSAALFGSVAAGAFYGVNTLLPQTDSGTASISA